MRKFNELIIKNNEIIFYYFIVAFLCSSSLFLITIRGWSSSILIVGSLFCIIYLFIYPATGNKKDILLNKNLIVITITFSLPVLSVATSSIFRDSFIPSQLDSPFRFIAAATILFFVVNTKTNTVKFLQFFIPLSLFITIIQQYLMPQPMLWGPERMATYFADPLVFGYTSLTLGLMCLVSINILNNDSNLLLIIKITGALIGIYLSIQSESRSGWLAAPIIISLWLHQMRLKENIFYYIKIIFSIFIVILITYFFVSKINNRINLTIDELINYSWDGIAPATSIGFRITFLRMAWDIFIENPWMGVGETSLKLFSIPEKIYSYASAEAIETALKSGFHNEIITNMIRFGLLGFISSISLFLIPFVIFFSRINSTNKVTQANSLIGITFVTSIFISSLSTEVFDLKYTASFYALMVTMLCGSAITRHE